MTQGLFSGQRQKLKRTARLVQVLFKYGFRDLAQRMQQQRAAVDPTDDVNSETYDGQEDVYTRIRMVLEELGPTYVKFGQAFSSREDLLPPRLVAELKRLQDQVKPELLDVRAVLAETLGIEPDAHFSHIDERPFAAASIAQVYRARLTDGTEVILKIKRPGIREAVIGDLLMMKDVVRLLVTYNDMAKRMNLTQVLETFEASVHEELSLYHELRNLERFARNFSKEPDVHVIRGYPELSNDEVLCMAYVNGTKINDRDALLAQGIDLDKLVDRGLRLYLTQVLEHGFFHADPHPGNLLVLPDGRIAFIDLGSMGTMTPADQELLEDFVMHFMAKDSRRLIETIRKMAIRIHIADERQLEREIHLIFEMLDRQSLAELNIKELFTRFSGILNDNEALLPDHIYLLVRGIVLIEGIGRELSPSMNIVERIQPYVRQRIHRRLQPDYLFAKGLETFKDMRDTATALHTDLPLILRQLRDGKLQVQQEVRYSQQVRRARHATAALLCCTLLTVGFAIAGALMIAQSASPSPMAVTTFVLSGFFLLVAIRQLLTGGKF